MYKVKTNQTDLPLSQLQICTSRAHDSRRVLLPASRLGPAPQHMKLVTPTRLLSQGRDIEVEVEDHISIPSSSPLQFMSPDRSASHGHNLRHKDFATPILPRSRDGYSLLDSRGSPEPDPEVTSSVVKGRAANDLLSLMGCGPRHT
jgi:hypothetical protein